MQQRSITYQLKIRISKPVRWMIGKLGIYDFPAGQYIYTGSALRNIEARIARHQNRNKKLKWYIDYLLAVEEASVTEITRFAQSECEINQNTAGAILIPRFGASDCRSGCGSHLKYQSAL